MAVAFLVEGLPCVIVGTVLFFALDDGPQNAKWLNPAEKQFIASQVSSSGPVRHSGLSGVVRDWRIYVLSFSYFCMISGLYAVGFWLPTLVRSAGVHRPLYIGLLTAIPYIASVIAMVTVARHSDAKEEQRLHSSISCLIAAIFLAVTATTLDNIEIAMPALVVAMAALYSAYTVFWAIPGNYLKGRAAAGGMAFINSLGLIGGFVSPIIIGTVKDVTGSFQWGLMVIAAMMAAGAVALAYNRVKPPC